MPRRITYDIETAFNIGGYFGKRWDANIGIIIQRGFVLGFAYKDYDKKRAKTCYVWDFPLFKKDPTNDIEVVKKWCELMRSTDVVMGWNSDKFDNRVMMGRVLVHKLPPVPMPQSVDVMKAIKKIANYDSYKLDDISEIFGHGNKEETKIQLWWDCMRGVKKAQKEMESYNIRDVILTEKDYQDVLPHMVSHPNMANIAGRPKACPKCLAEGKMWAQGVRYTKTGQYRRWQCLACGSYISNRNQEKGLTPPEFV